MRVRRVARSRATRRERGAVAVEAALVSPVLILILFGIIEFGLLFKDWLGMTSAVRAGARIASAEPRSTTFATDAASQVTRQASGVNLSATSELWVYRATGTTGAPSGCGTNCIKFTWNTTTKQFQTATPNAWAPTSQNACVGDSNRDSVGVYLQVDHPSITGLVFSSMTLKEYTVMTLEPIPGAGCK